jgi:hypothetical protein
MPSLICSNKYCLDGWVDRERGNQDGTESWVEQVPCQVCCIHCDLLEELPPAPRIEVEATGTVNYLDVVQLIWQISADYAQQMGSGSIQSQTAEYIAGKVADHFRPV